MFHPDLAMPASALLKSQTAEAHVRLESLMLLRLQAIQTAKDYAAVLKLFYGYFSPLEKLIDTIVNSSYLPDYGHRRKAHFILADLASLDESLEDLATATDLPAIATRAEAFGALYVMEGSTLGGRGIMRMLYKSLPQLSPAALRFFNGYGESTGPMWIAFQQALNALESAEEQRQMTATANETFIKFGQWIQQTT